MRQSTKNDIKDAGLGVGAIFGIVALALVLIAAVFAVTVWWAPWKGAGEQRKIVQGSGQYRIAAYERFYDDCAAIQGLEDQIATIKANTTLPENQRTENLLALTNKRNTMIRQYNADSAKTDTVANFKASDLPYEIDPAEETTTCAAE